MMHTPYLKVLFVLLWLSCIFTFFAHPPSDNHNEGATERLVDAR